VIDRTVGAFFALFSRDAEPGSPRWIGIFP
jgi:hypothetical protein